MREFCGWLTAERARWGLWLPVALGGGIALYFAMPIQPPAWILWPLGTIILSGAWLARSGAVLPAALAAIALGIAAAELSTLRASHPVITGRTGPVTVEGRILTLDAADEQRARILLDRLASPDPRVAALGAVRLSIDQDEGAPMVAVGQRVTANAVLLPPPGPALAGAPDYGIKIWFDGIGAVGYAVAPVMIGDAAVRPPALEAVRQAVAARIEAALPGASGAVATALTVGLRGRVPDAVEERWRDSGIAHILSISGLHLSLAAGAVFFTLRLVLAACGSLALHHPVKKWAAVAAICSSFAYMLLAGAEVPAIRSFVMTAILFMGVVVDRLAVTMRLVAVAAGLILLIEPNSLLHVSFGMSFAAVVGLVAVYEALRDRAVRWHQGFGAGLPGRALLYLAGIALSSLTATVVTAPFALHHFGRFVVYGIVTNLLAIPVTAFVVMPAAVAAALAMALGLEAWPLAVMGWGIAIIDGIAARVAALPHAVLLLPALPGPGLVAMVLGGLWLAVWQNWRLRLPGLAGFALAVVLWMTPPPPDLLIHQDGRAVAATESGRLVVLAPATPGFVVDQWQAQLGLPDRVTLDGNGTIGPLACKGFRCDLVRPAGAAAILRGRPRYRLRDCPSLVVAPRRTLDRGLCRPPAPLVLDERDLAGMGTISIWLGPTPRLRRSEPERGRRPWTPAYWTDDVSGSGDKGRPARPEP